MTEPEPDVHLEVSLQGLHPFCPACEWMGHVLPVHRPPWAVLTAQLEYAVHQLQCKGRPLAHLPRYLAQ